MTGLWHIGIHICPPVQGNQNFMEEVYSVRPAPNLWNLRYIAMRLVGFDSQLICVYLWVTGFTGLRGG